MTRYDVCSCGKKEHAPPTVLDALRLAFEGEELQAILRNLQYKSDDDFWLCEQEGYWTIGIFRNGLILE